MQILGIGVLVVTAVAVAARLLVRGRVSFAVWRWVVSVLSVGVLAAWQPLALGVTLALLAITLAVDAAAAARRPRKATGLLWAGTALLLAPLVFYKYAPAAWTGVAAIPLGLSFTAFRLIGVLWDHANLRMRSSVGEITTLALFYPTIPAGPITGVTTFRAWDGPGTAVDVGVQRIIGGLGKKLLLADGLYAWCVGGWLAGGIASLGYAELLILPVVLGLYLYWDFSGYSDIAIGLAAVLGFRVPENFQQPYLSTSVVDFWRRWHITLSEWIRLRVMMKLVGRRPTLARFHAAVIGAMALCGVWHGAGWNFLVWGVWHGAGLSAVHLFREAQRTRPWAQQVAERLGPAAATALTFAFVSAGWILFFFPLAQAGEWVARVVTLDGASVSGLGAPAGVLIASVLAFVVVEATWWERVPAWAGRIAWTLVVAAVTYMLCLSGSGSGDFIYASF